MSAPNLVSITVPSAFTVTVTRFCRTVAVAVKAARSRCNWVMVRS